MRLAVRYLVCRTLFGDEVVAATAAAEAYWPEPIDRVPSIVLVVAGTVLTGSGAADSCVFPTGTDASSDRCKVA